TTPTGMEHFVIDDVPVYSDVQAALAKQPPTATGLIAYAKERSWDADFASAPVKVYFPGAAHIITVPLPALVRDAIAGRGYVQLKPDATNYERLRRVGAGLRRAAFDRAAGTAFFLAADFPPSPCGLRRTSCGRASDPSIDRIDCRPCFTVASRSRAFLPSSSS